MKADASQGIYGAFWARLNISWSKKFRAGTRVNQHPVLEVLLVRAHQAMLSDANLSWYQISIVTSLASYSNPLSRMGGVEYVAEVSTMGHHMFLD